MSNLPKQVLDSLETVMYDDMCHLAKYSKNPVRNIFQKISVQYIQFIKVRAEMNDLVKKFNSMKLLIDKFHFKVIS